MTSSRLTVGRAMLAVFVCAAGCSNPEQDKARHLKRGDQYVAQKRDEFAIVEFASALKIDPKFGEAHLKLAQAYERTNNLRGAFAEYVRAADALPNNRDAQVKATEILLVTRRFEDAKARAAVLVKKDPQDVEARLLQANATAGLNDAPGALAQVQEALAVDPRSSRALVTLGSIRVRLGQPKEAEEAFRQAIAIEPTSSVNRLALATLLLSARRLPEAETELTGTLSKEPKNLLANRMLADLYIATQRVAAAEQPLKTVAEVSGDSASRFQLADYYIGTKRAKEAVETLTALSKEPATFAEAETRLSSIEYADGKSAEARKRLDVLLGRAPKYVPALALKAQWLTEDGKLNEALEVAQAAVASDGQSGAAHLALAAVQDRRGETVNAIKSYTEVLRLNPQAAGASAALSRLNLAVGQRDAALRYGEEARRVEPTSVQARVVLIRSLIANRNVERAETETAELLRGAPNAAIAHSLQGLVLAERKNVSGARAAFQRALELSPGFPLAISGLTALDLQAKVPQQAVARLESELSRQPNSTFLLSLAAETYTAAGDKPKAEQALRRAVAADPGFTAGYERLARLYMQQNRVDEARAEYEAMVKRDPAAVGPRTMVGVLLETQGKRAEASKLYEQIVGAGDSAPVAANNLAFIYAEQGTNLDMALQLATSVKPQLPNDPRVDDTIGWVYYKKGLFSLAAGPLEASSKRMPDSAEVLYHLGLNYAALGEKGKARDALAKALAIDSKVGGDAARKTLASLSQ